MLQAVHVAFQQVVAHQVESRLLPFLQVLSDDVGFGIESDAVLHGGMLLEEPVQHHRVFAVAFGVQVQFPDVAGRVMLLHVFAEAYLAPFLLVRPHNAFVYLAEDDNLLRLFPGEQHQHAGGEIAASVRVLSEEGEGGLFLDVGVYIYIRYIPLCQFVRERFSVLWGGGGKQHPVRFRRQHLPGCFHEGAVVVGVVVRKLRGDVEVGIGLHGFVYAGFYLRPVFALLVLRQQAGEGVLLVRCQCAGIHVGLVVQLFHDFFHPHAAGFGNAASSVNHTVHGSHRYIRQFGDVFDSNSFHCTLFVLAHNNNLNIFDTNI